MNTDGVTIGRNSWPEDLGLNISPEDIDSLPLTDREALFDGMREFFANAGGFEVIERREEFHTPPGTSAPLLIPRTKVFIRVHDTLQGWFFDAVEAAVLFAVTGNNYPLPVFVGLSIDFVKKIFEKMSKLDESEIRILKTILKLYATKKGKLPTTKAVAKELKETSSTLEIRLESLKSRGIIQYEKGGWRVVF